MSEPDSGDVRDSDALQAFITSRQPELLAHAARVVRDSPTDRLAGEVHRLIGTLGAYQLMSAATALQELQTLCGEPRTAPADVAACRARTLAVLTAMFKDMPTRAKDEQP